MKYEFDTTSLNRIKSILEQRRESRAVAESVTAGRLQFALASADEALKFFQGGITAYNLGQKTRHLDIDPIYAFDCNCVSDEIAKKMALNVCNMFCCDWGIGITGYATAVPESHMQVFCHFGIAYKGTVVVSGRIEDDSSDAPSARKHYVDKVIQVLLMHLEKHNQQRTKLKH
jgi:nicotinamide-nucleotide amidase